GTVTYYFYNTATPVLGTTTPVFTDPEPVGTHSINTAHLAAGNYSFIAVYGGDTNNLPATSPIEPLVIAKAGPPLLTTTILDSGGGAVTNVLGESVKDTSTFGTIPAGVIVPTGTVTYTFSGSELQFLTVPAGFTKNGSGATETWTETVTIAANGTIPNTDPTGALVAGTGQTHPSRSSP